MTKADIMADRIKERVQTTSGLDDVEVPHKVDENLGVWVFNPHVYVGERKVGGKLFYHPKRENTGFDAELFEFEVDAVAMLMEDSAVFFKEEGK